MDDLEKFREHWKEELKNHLPGGKAVKEEDPKWDCTKEAGAQNCVRAKDFADEPDHEPDQALKASSSKSLSLAPLPPQSLAPAGSVKSIPKVDHDELLSKSLQQEENAFQLQTKEPDTHEYYPFKILTQFLNEAPKKAKPRSKKSSSSSEKPQSCLTYAKRKYFRDEAETLSKTKMQKTDDVEVKTVKDAPITAQAEKGAFLDLFIADLDEINEIPFFDTTLPRELAMNIFQHFDMQTLCNCSQVSRSWKSLADDELLWCQICHTLGYDGDLTVSETTNWKQRVQQYIEHKRLLIANWKARVGKPYYLQYARGGVLCAVSSCGSQILAGYTSCDIRTWDTKSGDTCTFSASNTALVIDESTEELGRIPNEVQCLCATQSHTASAFRHGFVDIWHNEGEVDPIHTLTFRNPDVSSLSVLDLDPSCCLLATSQASRVQVVKCVDEEVVFLRDFNAKATINQLAWYSRSHRSVNPGLLLCCHSSVYLAEVDPDPLPSAAQLSIHAENQQLTEIHNIIWSPISCTKCRSSEDEVAVGFTSSGAALQDYKVNIYDLPSGRQKSTLLGHTWLTSCMDLPEDLPSQIVTGSGDRKIRLYDTRSGRYPVSTLTGHVAKVTTVQMDDWKVVSGDEGGFVCVWDQRMHLKLWDIHNRHPVQYCRFQDRLLTIGNVPYQKFPGDDEFDNMSSLRYRGTVQVYDFMANQLTQGIPDICLSSYNEPEAYDYNIGLAVPYDQV